MSTAATPDKDRTDPVRERRAYDSPVRRQRAAETRERIVEAGSALVHSFTTWDWRSLTFRAVAERAGVSERTVYRHFATERELLDAIMRRLEEEAGLTYDQVDLDDLATVTARSFATLSSFAVSPWTPEDFGVPTLVAEDRRRRDALIGAVGRRVGAWPDPQRRMAAALLDVLWSVPAYERLLAAWKLDAGQATDALTWAIDLLVEAIRDGRAPGRVGRAGTAGEPPVGPSPSA